MLIQNNQIRIIGGRFRGKVLRIPQVTGLRPTSERFRETLFDWLGDAINGALVLDLFAGSGALGFEALSRGAAQVTLVECEAAALANLKQSATSFGVGEGELEIIGTDALQYLAECNRSFDLILLDPPYHGNLLKEAVSLIAAHNCLKAGGVLYTEHSAGRNLILPGFERLRSTGSGQVSLSLWRNSSLLL